MHITSQSAEVSESNPTTVTLSSGPQRRPRLLLPRCEGEERAEPADECAKQLLGATAVVRPVHLVALLGAAVHLDVLLATMFLPPHALAPCAERSCTDPLLHLLRNYQLGVHRLPHGILDLLDDIAERC